MMKAEITVVCGSGKKYGSALLKRIVKIVMNNNKVLLYSA